MKPEALIIATTSSAGKWRLPLPSSDFLSSAENVGPNIDPCADPEVGGTGGQIPTPEKSQK